MDRRHASDPVSLWLWRRLAAVAPIRPVAWELPYASGAALKSKKKKVTKRESRKDPSPPGPPETQASSSPVGRDHDRVFQTRC